NLSDSSARSNSRNVDPKNTAYFSSFSDATYASITTLEGSTDTTYSYYNLDSINGFSYNLGTVQYGQITINDVPIKATKYPTNFGDTFSQSFNLASNQGTGDYYSHAD